MPFPQKASKVIVETPTPVKDFLESLRFKIPMEQDLKKAKTKQTKEAIQKKIDESENAVFYYTLEAVNFLKSPKNLGVFIRTKEYRDPQFWKTFGAALSQSLDNTLLTIASKELVDKIPDLIYKQLFYRETADQFLVAEKALKKNPKDVKSKSVWITVKTLHAHVRPNHLVKVMYADAKAGKPGPKASSNLIPSKPAPLPANDPLSMIGGLSETSDQLPFQGGFQGGSTSAPNPVPSSPQQNSKGPSQSAPLNPMSSLGSLSSDAQKLPFQSL
jgi:hypothetical protein